MNAPLISVEQEVTGLPDLVQRAARNLASASTSAEVLDAHDLASVVYDSAKKAARMAKARRAHDDLITAAHRAQADALEIESLAKRRLADEYDAAQERGEVATGNRSKDFGVPDRNAKLPSAADLGLSRKLIHEARQIRDAEEIQPGITHEVAESALKEGRAPTKAELRKSVIAAVEDARRPKRRERNPNYVNDPFYKRIARLGSLCREIATYEEIRKIARWNEIPQTAKRLPGEVTQAHEVLGQFLKEKKDA